MTEFVFGLESESTPPEPASVAPGSGYDLEPVDHDARAVARLPMQFREQPNINALVKSRSDEAQELENELMALRTLSDIENSVGAQLDVIGKIVRQPREGRTDEVYRVWLRARIRLNRSSGTPVDVLEVLRLAAGQTPIIQYIPEPPAAFSVQILGLTEDVDSLRVLLSETTAAGVRSLLEYSEDDGSALFMFTDMDESPTTLGFSDELDPGTGGVLIGVLEG